MSVLVVDVGTSGLRAAVMRPDGDVTALHYRAFPPNSPFPGMVEFDAVGMAAAVLEVAHAALAEGGPVVAVGITAQRASTIVWDRATGEPVGPGIGWQDLRTVFDCITAKADHGLQLAPNQSATKVAWLLNTYDPTRQRDLCFGTVDTWVAWVLSKGSVHVTDHSNAAVTGLLRPDASGWSTSACEKLDVPTSMLPTLVDTSSVFGEATALPGSPPLAALVGDQQGSLVGQSCVRPGQAKITFGTGGMLDMCTDSAAPTTGNRTPEGIFPIVAWSLDGICTWGVEAIMLSAGSNVEWLVQDLGILENPAQSHDVAAQCETAEGVVYVPALMGLGTPHWDYGARGTMLGLTRGSGRAQVTRAVLEGIAHRGADLVDAAQAGTGYDVPMLRVDGGMSENPTFVQALANATGKPVEVSRYTEATTVGAGYLAGLAVGVWSGFDDIAEAWQPRTTVDPNAQLDRAQWAEAVQRSKRWIPDLSALDF
ncbi:MAG TPA: FGGY family carbohydrate kinase [Ilumatobacteraceae bacterium]|nr:FGGY family carbohydrate kinase [Ilumatobacteraceae bacterium]